MIDIEKLENMPQRIGIMKAAKTSKEQRKALGRTSDHCINGCHPWTIATRVLTYFLGKSVDDAFSYYCKKVPPYQQKMFWDQFTPRRYWSNSRQWYIDENGLVQNDNLNQYRGPYHIYSHDYKAVWVLVEQVSKRQLRYMDITYDSIYQIPYSIRHLYEHRVVSGKKWTFESKNDPRYQKHYQEKLKAERKRRREERKAKEAKVYIMHTEAELHRRKLARITSRVIFELAKDGLHSLISWKLFPEIRSV